MSEVSSLLLTFLREAWVALAGAFVAFALLAGIAQVLRVSSASVLGANLWVWESISALISIVSRSAIFMMVLASLDFSKIPPVSQEKSSGGSLRFIIRDELRRSIASGEQDGAMAARYAVAPRKTLR